MKQISKRLFAVLLAVCMLAGLAPMTSAESETETAEWTTVETAGALDAAIAEGGNIKLGNGFDDEEAIARAKEGYSIPPILKVSENVTLDLNGQTLQLTRYKDENTDNRNTYGIYLTNGATLTVVDSSEIKDKNGAVTTPGRGKITADCYYLVGMDYDNDLEEVFTLESGT